jgi:hypothetical protein
MLRRMSWNYRVVRRVIRGEVRHAIHEVHYDEKQVPTGVTVRPVDVTTFAADGKPDAALRWILTKMLSALKRPILEYSELGQRRNGSSKKSQKRPKHRAMRQTKGGGRRV